MAKTEATRIRLYPHERAALEASPEEELHELAAIYESRGMSHATALQAAREVSERDALAAHIRDELGLSDMAVAGVAKGPDRDAGREHFHIPGRASFMLDGRDPVLYYIQRLRDEAHRFAIGSHRARRSKAIGVNPLDEVAGIGPLRKKALLQAFGSAKAVSRASVTDLAAVEGVSTALAQAIYDHFHESAE